MDNNSHRYSNEDTTTSMYLSFDAESTMSTACYKTLEAMSDTSTLSVIGIDNLDKNKTRDDCINSTLEMDVSHNSHLKTVKKTEISEMKLNAPLRPLPKNILKEYKAICSTPSKEQLLKTVDVTRGSDATRCVDLGLAFLGIDDEKPAYFPPPNIVLAEENKENVLPDIEEMSTLSTCSSVEVPSVIEKKMSSISTACSVTEEESVEDMKVDQIKNYSLVGKECGNAVERQNVGDETGKIKYHPECAAEERVIVAPDFEVEKKDKTKIAVLSRNSRLSVCEPNLQTGKPSRILISDNKRRSLLPTSKKATTCIDAEIEIPLLMNKVLKLTSANKNTAENSESKKKLGIPPPKKNLPIDKRRSFMPSLLTSSSLNKRPFSFTQRMSVVVRTTLNSPARKIARRSALSGAKSPTQRKSTMPQITTLTGISNIKKPETSLRKTLVSKPSFANMNPQANRISLAPSQEKPAGIANANSQRKSLCPLLKSSIKDPMAGSSQKKMDIYTCNVCNDQFRIKSLLDAHKRSHESDSNPPAFIKKQLILKKPLSDTLFVNSNQCKYCDKKFALSKALHIHLLQNCPKIPPTEKRKLQYTDLNHVEKAQLPNVFLSHNLGNNAVSIKKNSNTKLSSDSLNDYKGKMTANFSTPVNANSTTASKIIAPKVKKFSAHAGICRTPSKSILCHLCKSKFKNVLDYTNHNLTTHSNKAKEVNDTGKDLEF